MVCIFLFRRDLRIQDNRAWTNLCTKTNQPVAPIFIFQDTQCNPDKSPYFSGNSFRFLRECLEDLTKQCPLQQFHVRNQDEEIQLLTDIHNKNTIHTIAFNRDNTPFARKRDERITKWANQHAIECITDTTVDPEYTLVSPENPKSLSGKQTPYKVFTPFYRNAKKIDIPKPQRTTPKTTPRYARVEAPVKYNLPSFKDIPRLCPEPKVRGGRTRGLQMLDNVNHTRYEAHRDTLAEDATTHLSAYIKFGCISLREAYHGMKSSEMLLRQLYWRDFYAHVAYHFPHVLAGMTTSHANESMNQALDPRLASFWVSGREKTRRFTRFTEGTTGIPIVDAGIHELRRTGYMHNRARMIVASFLVKDLHIDWREGERFFAQWLIDYDPAANSGGWQWAASTGADAQPYFRIFNPWLQVKRFDPNQHYIAKHAATLPASVSAEPPLVDEALHKERAEQSKAAYASAS